MDNKLPVYWANKYVGKPWRNGARGPDAFDCWGLLYWIYLHHLQISVPLFGSISSMDKVTVAHMITAETLKHPSQTPWARISKPTELCAVAMGVKHFTHVGIYSERDGGNILHAGDNVNVVFQRASTIQRILPRIEFFRHGLHC